MDTTLFLLMIILLPVVFSYMFVKVIQTPVNKPRRDKLSHEDHREIREKASIVIMPFPTDTHHKYGTTQQPKKMDSYRTSGE